MFSPGANDPRATVPPNARDSTSRLPSNGGGLWDKSSYTMHTRLERGDCEKILLGRMDLASDRTFLVPSKSYGRHDRGEGLRNFGGELECSTTKPLNFSSQTASGSKFSNASSLATVPKPYPGLHGLYKENFHYGSPVAGAGDASHGLLPDNTGGRRDHDLYVRAAEAASGSRGTSLVHRTKDLSLHMDDGACFKAGDKMQDFSTTELVKTLCIDFPYGCRASSSVSKSTRKCERDSKIKEADKNLRSQGDDVSQVRNVVNKVAAEAKTGIMVDRHDGGDSSVSNFTVDSSLKHSSRIISEKVASASRRSGFPGGNGFSNELISRLPTPMVAALVTPKSSSQSSLQCSTLGSIQSAENSTTRKKPRLGWGQGLAKYEQKKVEVNVSSSATVGGCSSELLESLSTDDEQTALRNSSQFPSMTSSRDSNHDLEGRVKVEISAELSRESCCEEVQGEAIQNEDLGTLHWIGTAQEQAGSEILERVQSSQLQVEQVLSCSSLGALVFEKQNEVSSASHRNATHDSLPCVEGVSEADYSTPSCAADWTKQDILDGVEKLELEIDLLEREILTLDLDGEDNLQNALAASLANEAECHKQQTCCIVATNLEEPSMSEGTLIQQQHVDEHQTLHSPFNTLTGCQIEQSLEKPNDARDQTNDFENEDRFIPGHDIINPVSQEMVNENGICDTSECVGTKVLSVPMESLPSYLRRDYFLVDMQKLHLQSVHALLEENQIQSRDACNPFDYLTPESLPAVDGSHLPLHSDISTLEYDLYDGDAPKEQIFQKLVKSKQLIRFKEHALALKYRVLKELWRQEQLGNCVKKDRSKAFRKYENERKDGAAFAAKRFSLRLRPTLSVSGKSDAIPDEGKFLSKTVADRCTEYVRPFLKMPAMVLDKKERNFVSKNGLVEDPVSLEEERKTMNPWNFEEKQIFLEKFAAFNKNFSKIASYLENKTTADCVVFYYKNRKSEDFEKIQRRDHLKKRKDFCQSSASYLSTTIFPAGGHILEGNSALVENMFPLAFANSSSRGILTHRTGPQKSSDCIHVSGHNELISGKVKKSIWTKEGKGASNLLSVAAEVVSGDIMNPCSPSASACPPKGGIQSNLLGEGAVGQMSLRSNTAPFGESRAIPYVHGRDVSGGKSMRAQLESLWSDNEKQCFIDALSLYGKDFKRIAQHIKTKTQGQCKSFFSKSRKRLNLDQILDRSGSRALCEATMVKTQPNSNLENVRASDVMVYVNSVRSPEIMLMEESPGPFVEATTKGSWLRVSDAQISTNNIKVLFEDDKIKESVNEQDFDNPHHHTPESSPGSRTTERTWETNELLHCTQPVCHSSTSICMSKSHIKEMLVLEGEGCNRSPAKTDDANIQHTNTLSDNEVAQHTGSALNKEVTADIATNSFTASSGGVPTEHEPLHKRPKLEADSVSNSSSVPLAKPDFKLLAHQVSHAVKPLKAMVAIKDNQLQEKAAKLGGETRNRREATSWTTGEKVIFAETIKQHGKDWTLLQERLPLKSLTHIKTYFQNSKAKLGYGAEHIGNGNSQGACSLQLKADETDTIRRSFPKSNFQKAGQLHGNAGGLNANSVDQNAILNAEQLALSLLAQNTGQAVEDTVAVNDIQLFLKQLCSSGSQIPPGSSEKPSAGGIREVASSAANFLGMMHGQMLSGSLHASIQSSTCSNNQRQSLPHQQLQLAESASRKQPTHSLHQKQVPASSFPFQISGQISNQVAHQFQRHAAHQQQQKQVFQFHRQLHQAHQPSDMVSPVSVGQLDVPDSAAHFHKPVLPTHHQSPDHVSNQQYALVKQQEYCQFLNQQKAVEQQMFSSEQQQKVSKHKQQTLIQQQKQLHETPVAQIAQHQLLQQQELKNIVLQQPLHTLGQSEDYHNDIIKLQVLQHLHMKGSQQALQQHNFQMFNSEGTTSTEKQSSYFRPNHQTRVTAASVQGALPGLGSGSDTLNPSVVEWKRPLVSQLSPEVSRSSQPDSEVSVPAHSRGEICSERQPGCSGDVKLFGQSLLTQPSNLSSKSSSVSPTGRGRFLSKPFSPNMSASLAAASTSSMLSFPKFLGNGSVPSCSLDREAHDPPGYGTVHQGKFLSTRMANENLSRSAVLKSIPAVQDAFSCLSQRSVQTQHLEHDTYGEFLTALSEHADVYEGTTQPCIDEKQLHISNTPVKGRSEQNLTASSTNVSINQLDGAIGYYHAKVDKSGKSDWKGPQSLPNTSHQRLSHGLLSAIKAITVRQSLQGSKCTGNATQVDDNGPSKGSKGLEASKASGMAEVPISSAGSHAVGHDILHLLQSYLLSSQVLDVPKQAVSYDNVFTAGGSRVDMTDNLELVPKHLVVQSTFQEPLRSLDSQEVNSTGSSR